MVSVIRKLYCLTSLHPRNTNRNEIIMKEVKYEEGKTYILDTGRHNSGLVVLKKILGKYFCTVTSLDGQVEWDCMINRLTIFQTPQADKG
jgi:hypothetical protein